jgi:predicted amidohydrolase YtcJ
MSDSYGIANTERLLRDLENATKNKDGDYVVGSGWEQTTMTEYRRRSEIRETKEILKELKEMRDRDLMKKGKPWFS